ncbi:MAG: adenylate/guanylate cyclase domain-containing protein [Holosporales bacterium]|jgi:adenylate cyclase|nr:adenylate/guanylate cyclase domain-containing protein [Holosporales bacterium]
MKFLRGRKLRFDILVAFSVLICLVTVCEILFSFTAYKKLILNFEEEYYSKTVSRATVGYMDAYFTQLEVVLNVLANDFDETAPDKFAGFDKLFLESLKDIQHTFSFYMALNDGSFIQARRTEYLNGMRSDPNTELSQYAKFAIKRITKDPSTDAFTETWVYLNEELGEVGKESLPCPNNVTTKRDWYTSAEFNRAKIWSDAYVFSSVKVCGITLSMPLGFDKETNVIGVICIDLVFDHIKKILQTIQTTQNSQIYLINAKNEILSTTADIKSKSDDENDGTTLVKMTDANDPVLKRAAKIILGSDEKHCNFSQDGVEYAVFVKKLSKLPLSVLAISPCSDFMKQSERITKEMALLFLAIFLVSIVIILLFSRGLTKPIATLCDAAKAIGEMDLENCPDLPKSNILEIKQLANTMHTMKLSISTFTKYAPKDLVNKLIEQGVEPALGGKSAIITLLFTDIEKFSTTSENLPPEYLILHLSDYFQALTEAIMDYNGSIDKYIGDSIMAIWGAPTKDENHAINACYAGMKCLRVLEEITEKWKVLGKPALPTRIGIHTGTAIVGNIGSLNRMNYTAIGDSVNVASRLEGVNKYYGTKILVSETVETIAKSKILFRVIDKVAVKGRRSGLLVYEPMCIMDEIEEERYRSLARLCSRTREAFELYQNCRFKDAIRLYEHLLREFPELQASMIPVLRTCLKYLEDSSEDWDGINYLDEK